MTLKRMNCEEDPWLVIDKRLDPSIGQSYIVQLDEKSKVNFIVTEEID